MFDLPLDVRYPNLFFFNTILIVCPVTTQTFIYQMETPFFHRGTSSRPIFCEFRRIEIEIRTTIVFIIIILMKGK